MGYLPLCEVVDKPFQCEENEKCLYLRIYCIQYLCDIIINKSVNPLVVVSHRLILSI